ncbi:MAG: nuclease-related domain-containing protein, partial [Verrucomicrobiota bacterium]
TTQTATGMVTILLIGVLIGLYLFVPLFLFKRRKAARNLQPPEVQTALRGPGESLRRRADQCLEEMLGIVLKGAPLSLVFAATPGLLLFLWPQANPWPLFLSGIALFLAAFLVIVGKMSRLLDQHSRARLGWLGECKVAEHLTGCQRAGFHVVHDVTIEKQGRTMNIDHVVIGRSGVVVIETKMRSKPEKAVKEKIEVIYDGESISWPRFKGDTKPLWQVKECASWLKEFFRKECGVRVPVKTVIAIPGWSGKELSLGQPRVVSGAGVSDAVQQAVNADLLELSPGDVNSMYRAVVERCRDVDLA